MMNNSEKRLYNAAVKTVPPQIWRALLGHRSSLALPTQQQHTHSTRSSSTAPAPKAKRSPGKRKR